MKTTFYITLAMVFGAAAAPAFAADAGAYKAPRNSLGQPDLEGTWSNASLTPQIRNPLFGTRGVATPEEVAGWEAGAAHKVEVGNAKSDLNVSVADSKTVGGYNQGFLDGGSQVMRVRGEPRTSLLTTPDGQVPVPIGQPPRVLLPDAGSVESGRRAVKQASDFDPVAAQGATEKEVQALKEGKYDNPENRPPAERCIVDVGGRAMGPPMFPNGFYNNNYQIAQSRDSVAIVIEMIHDARVVRLNGKHRTDGVRPYFGDAIGHYDGDTLVVETTNFPKSQPYHGSWENLKVTERFTRLAKDRIVYQFTIEDPTMWDKPWGGEYEFHPTNGRIQEYACHEGNYALEAILAGARQKEKENASASNSASTAR